MTTVHIIVTPKRSVLDPQGEAVKKTLQSMGLGKVAGVRVGKFIELEIDDTASTALKARLSTISHELLSNPVIEDYELKFPRPLTAPARADFEGVGDPDEESSDELVKLEAKPKKAAKKLVKLEKKAAKSPEKEVKKKDDKKDHKKSKKNADTSGEPQKKKK